MTVEEEQHIALQVRASGRATIIDNGFGTGKTGLGVDHPLLAHQRVQHRIDLVAIADPWQSPGLEGCAQATDEAATNMPRQCPDWEQRIALGRMPGARSIGQRPARHQAVQVDMTHQRLNATNARQKPNSAACG